MKNLFLLTLVLSCTLCLTTQAQELDFGDMKSETLTQKAWDAFGANKHDDAIAFAKKCIELYEKEAIEMQKSMTEPVPPGDNDAVSSKWALNDVGTCYFIKGQALEKQDKGAEALKAYKTLMKNVSFAQCWDPKGWYWKPADAAKKQIKMLEFDAADDPNAKD